MSDKAVLQIQSQNKHNLHHYQKNNQLIQLGCIYVKHI